jgi:hypothetical protein
VAGAEDAEGFAVAGLEGGEEAGLDGGVDGVLEGVIDVLDAGGGRGRRRRRRRRRRRSGRRGDGYRALVVVQDEGGGPGDFAQGVRVDVAMRSGVVWGEEETIEGSVVLLEVEGDTACTVSQSRRRRRR